MAAGAVPGLEGSRAGHETTRGAHAPRIEILTSGTTGAPKPFALTFDVIARHMIGAGVAAGGSGQDLSDQPPTLLFFPLSNISGIYSTLPALLKGQRAVLLERFNIPGWHDHLMRYRPEASGMPPAGVQMLLDANIPRDDLSCIRRFGTGAAPLDPAVQHAFEERYGIPILLSYGATEFGGPVAAMTLDLHAEWGRKKFGSVGRAMPGAQLRVVDPQTGEPLPPDEEGILEVISPRIGPTWIRTSDVAVIDADGFLFHRGRADGAIMRGGFKVLPETIERALRLHPAVAAVAVVGIAHERLGQVPAVAMEVRTSSPVPTTEELESYLRDHVASTHIPVAWRVVESLPRNASFKIDRPAVRRLFEEPRG
jgi:acyl-coenzyme A synthetase/AMP-(fatty) acid ligase